MAIILTITAIKTLEPLIYIYTFFQKLEVQGSAMVLLKKPLHHLNYFLGIMSQPQRSHQSYTTTDFLAAAHSLILHHHQFPSHSAVPNPTPPPISQPQRTHQSYTTTDDLAAPHSPILHHHQCPSSSALTKTTPPYCMPTLAINIIFPILRRMWQDICKSGSTVAPHRSHFYQTNTCKCK